MMRLIQFVVFGAEIMMSVMNQNARSLGSAALLELPDLGSRRIQPAVGKSFCGIKRYLQLSSAFGSAENPREARERIVV
jgi:hypothetical protein